MRIICLLLRFGKRVIFAAGCFISIASSTVFSVQSQTPQATPDARYQTRPSDCRYEAPPGRALTVRKSDSGIKIHGYRAERIGNINIAVQPEPSLGVRALGGSNNGTVRIGIDDGTKREPVTKEFRNQDQVESNGYDRKAIRAEIRATSEHGNVNVTSVPAAALRPR